MNYKKLLQQRLIKKQTPDFKQIDNQLARAMKDLQAAEANLSIDLSWAVTIAYHAMIRGGRALLFSQGYLPTTKRTHKTIIEVTTTILGGDYKELVTRFNRLRRKRHNFIYDSRNDTTFREARLALKTADALIDQITFVIQSQNPQEDLNL